MKKRISKVGGLLEKKGLEKGQEYSEMFPETLGEIPAYLAENSIKAETFLQYAWRGRTLSFQGAGEPLSEEEKEVRKIARREENAAIQSIRKLAKEQGIPFADLLQKMLG